MIGVPIGLSRTPAVRGGVVPGIGEHTEQVLKDWLKLSDAEIQRMQAAKAF
jgi:crotonobetainyl-CoA:carnitine CoA-transferase CaiB-like acyl-CoA transferase